MDRIRRGITNKCEAGSRELSSVGLMPVSASHDWDNVDIRLVTINITIISMLTLTLPAHFTMKLMKTFLQSNKKVHDMM